ncbi:MAG TPA: hypothetical protein P5125_05775 [Kiritimatiellia bacterium]|nr:hypothetical protein [Kiritimatiellia bacterium]HOM58667.1 hypothetical protein [Kiritimatiellia bacterium]HOR98735.1 hypothetical protein [Kiritimatiellia bacterium]HRU19850.1 hypothetical protein [Kiritimatiellia bacterium]
MRRSYVSGFHYGAIAIGFGTAATFTLVIAGRFVGATVDSDSDTDTDLEIWMEP